MRKKKEKKRKGIDARTYSVFIYDTNIAGNGVLQKCSAIGTRARNQASRNKKRHARHEKKRFIKTVCVCDFAYVFNIIIVGPGAD